MHTQLYTHTRARAYTLLIRSQQSYVIKNRPTIIGRDNIKRKHFLFSPFKFNYLVRRLLTFLRTYLNFVRRIWVYSTAFLYRYIRGARRSPTSANVSSGHLKYMNPFYV